MKLTKSGQFAPVAALLLLVSLFAPAAASPVYRFTIEGTWTGGNPTLIGSGLGKPFEWDFLFDAGESPTENFNDDTANVPPEAQHTYAADGSTRTLFLDPDTSSGAEPLLARTSGAALRLQLTNDLTQFPPFGPIPASDLGSWINSVMTTAGPKDIRLDTPLTFGYQNSAIDSALSPPADAADLVTLFTEAAANGTPHTVSVTGLGLGSDPIGPVTSVQYTLVPEPSAGSYGCAILLIAFLSKRRVVV